MKNFYEIMPVLLFFISCLIFFFLAISTKYAFFLSSASLFLLELLFLKICTFFLLQTTRTQFHIRFFFHISPKFYLSFDIYLTKLNELYFFSILYYFTFFFHHEQTFLYLDNIPSLK